MLKHWSEATFVLEMLYQKCSEFDKDGVDLYFTCSDEKVQKAKKKDGGDRFRKLMLGSSVRPIENTHTDMNKKLGEKLGKWLEDFEKKGKEQKKLTILVLTDGIWEGNQQDSGPVNQTIINFDLCFKRLAGPFSDPRSVTIQFISFGDDPDALDRLNRLDNDLKYKAVA